MRVSLNKDELNKLGIDDVVISATTSTKEISCLYYNTLEDWYQSLEPDDQYVRYFIGEVIGVDDNCEKVCDIGWFKGSFFEAECVLDDNVESFLDLCDCIDQSHYNMAAAITDKHGNIKEGICGFGGNIVYLDRIYLEPIYRGLGIGGYIMRNFEKLLSFAVNLFPHTLVLEPMPQEKDEEGQVSQVEDEQTLVLQKKRLISFYRKCGFKAIRGTNYMMKQVRTLY